MKQIRYCYENPTRICDRKCVFWGIFEGKPSCFRIRMAFPRDAVFDDDGEV